MKKIKIGNPDVIAHKAIPLSIKISGEELKTFVVGE
jgi:hypothetical protein